MDRFAVAKDAAHDHDVEAQHGHHDGRESSVVARVRILTSFKHELHDAEAAIPCSRVQRRGPDRGQVECHPTAELARRCRIRRGGATNELRHTEIGLC